MADNFIAVSSVSAIGENEGKAFDVNGVSVLVCNTRDGFFAVENKCTHQLQALEGGKIKSCFIFCPLHGQRFNLKDGAPIGQLTDKPLTTYAVKVEGDTVSVSANPRSDAQD